MENKEIYLETGNLDKVNKNHPERRGWVLGSFVEESKLRNSKICEVKWTKLSKGEKIPSRMAQDSAARTLVILLSGKLKIIFSNKTVLLSEPADYIIYNNTIQHENEALEDSNLVTVRWREKN